MSARRAGVTGSVWERTVPRERGGTVPLDRATIAGAAVALADAEGLAAVSVRRLAAALGIGPMRLYGYVASTEELAELMIDFVYAEVRPSTGGWREALAELASELRSAALRHEWVADLLGGRPPLGPHALVVREAALACCRTAMDVRAAITAYATVQAYALGALRVEVGERRAARRSGQDEHSWQQVQGPYLQRALDTGRFPVLAELITVEDGDDPAQRYAVGLDCVLDGVAARLSS